MPARPTILQRPILPKRPIDAHKGEVGRVLVVGGERGMLGATLLAGEAALRCGSGLVTIASTAAHVDWPALRCTELMSVDAMQICHPHSAEKTDVVVLGPGLGQSDWSAQVFARFIDYAGPLVVDADGLNWLARKRRRRDCWVLTPHAGEAARLLGCTAREIQADRLHSAHAIVAKFGGVCVLKGAGTLVVCARGEATSAWLCEQGNAGMATAGMGDVLSGMLGSLLGQGMPFCAAAKTAVWLHAHAADAAANQLGERSLLARDVIAYLPEVIRMTE